MSDDTCITLAGLAFFMALPLWLFWPDIQRRFGCGSAKGPTVTDKTYEMNIHGNNAGIATQNQSGGANTVYTASPTQTEDGEK